MMGNVSGLTGVNRYRVRYKVCEGGMERMGAVLAKDWHKACVVALKTFPIVIEVMGAPSRNWCITDNSEGVRRTSMLSGFGDYR
jgi:hypothetical protein